MKMTKVHGCIEFTQKAIFKKYVEKKQRLRMLATTEIERQIHKTDINCIFGKSM
jgi:hypothetical protein